MVEVLSTKFQSLIAEEQKREIKDRVERTHLAGTEKIVRSQVAHLALIRKAKAAWRSPEYLDFSRYQKNWARMILESEHAEQVLRRFAGKLVPEAVFERKHDICTKFLGVCAPKRVDSSTASNCRLCGELMTDLGYLLKRGRSDVQVNANCCDGSTHRPC